MIQKRAIAFDIGNKRIGVAISDPFNEYAMPCETYVRTKNFDADVEAIAKIAHDRGVGVIVCGMPFNYDGTDSIQTVRTREFIEHLREKTDLPIELEDERFTTMQARETQIQGGIKLGDRKKTIDSIAASYILESYLNREKIKNKKREEPVMSEIKDEIYEEEDHIFEVEAEGKNSVRTQDKTTPDKDFFRRRLESAINGLYDQLIQALKVENERLRMENTALKAALDEVEAEVRNSVRAQNKTTPDKEFLRCRLESLLNGSSEQLVQALKEENERLRMENASLKNALDKAETKQV